MGSAPIITLPFTQLSKLTNWVRENAPSHVRYVEPVANSSNLFLFKEDAKENVLNCPDPLVACFFYVLKTQPQDLIRMVKATPYSRVAWARARAVLNNPNEHEFVTVAWAVFVGGHQNVPNSNTPLWNYARKARENVIRDLYENQKTKGIYEIADKIANFKVEHRPVAEAIKANDKPDTFFFIDGDAYFRAKYGPGYEYSGEWLDMLNVLAVVQGKAIAVTRGAPRFDSLVEQLGWKRMDSYKVISTPSFASDEPPVLYKKQTYIYTNF